MKVEQFVMAYRGDHDKIKALLPAGYESLRPVLRINAEILTDSKESDKGATYYYIEFNTPVEHAGKRGWLNLGNWDSMSTAIEVGRENEKITDFKFDLVKTEFKAGPARQVDRRHDERLVHGDEGASVSCHTARGHRLAEDGSQHDADVFGRVMVIDLNVPPADDFQIEHRVGREGTEHMIEKSAAGVDVGLSRTVNRQIRFDIGLSGFSLKFRVSH